MTFKFFRVTGLLLFLSACIVPPEYQAPLLRVEQGSPVFLAELARVGELTPEQRRREVAELEGTRRPLDETRRFQLAALLEREESVESLERSLKTLNGLGKADARTQALVDLMKKSIKSRIELRQQAARTQELQDKLEQIKALEKSLQQRTVPPGTP
ncbi:MAG: hypothetical protein ROZ09_04355 [Thiobacillus sp.]|uniref:hypothetical protein n=1 Tax=Thiobacillus sp. TaxID=924 RepID=UPI0028952707|nr:hypothetical protein [Thiobacillus sp.]MDT3706034.1 hypothetical protein [Thiobacillus sp.]